MKEIELILKYYENLEDNGTRLTPRDREHIRICKNILRLEDYVKSKRPIDIDKILANKDTQ